MTSNGNMVQKELINQLIEFCDKNKVSIAFDNAYKNLETPELKETLKRIAQKFGIEINSKCNCPVGITKQQKDELILKSIENGYICTSKIQAILGVGYPIANKVLDCLVSQKLFVASEDDSHKFVPTITKEEYLKRNN